MNGEDKNNNSIQRSKPFVSLELQMCAGFRIGIWALQLQRVLLCIEICLW
jgi:hypothetical protein